jgi:hypothetical protein
MKRKMKGNDLRFNWRVKDDEGHPYSVEEKDLTVVLRGPHGAVPVNDVSFEGNVVSFTFFGKDQKEFGIHTAVLIENAGRELMKTVDFVGAVELVAHTIQEGGSDSSQLSIDTVDLESTVVVGIPGPRGLSMYQYAVKYMGFEGTEREFWEWYKKAKDDADAAAASAGRAQASIEESEAERAATFARLKQDLEDAFANADSLVDDLRKFPVIFVEELPDPSENTMRKYYYIPSTSDPGAYEVYLSYKIEDTYYWKQVGSTRTDFEQYLRKDDIIELSESEYDALRVKDPDKFYLTHEDNVEEEEAGE